jgi:hypothetical protein
MLRVGLSNIKGPATSQRLPVHSRQAEKTRCIRPPHLRGGLMPLFVGKPHSSCATGQKLTYSHDHIRRNRSSNLTIHYDGKHIIVFDEHEKVQEGYRRKAWIELAGGIPTGSVFEGWPLLRNERPSWRKRRRFSLSPRARSSIASRMVVPKGRLRTDVPSARRRKHVGTCSAPPLPM